MQITLHTPATIYAARHLPSWLLLAAAAGLVNGFAFLKSEQFISHVTGLLTRAGQEYLHVGIAAEYAGIFLSFVLGAAAAVVLLQWLARENRPDRWAVPLGLVALTLTGVAAAGELGWFAPFGGHVNEEPPVILLSFLAFAAGMQNAAVAAATGMTVRTTHMTGPATDAGMLLGAAVLTSGAERRAALGGAALRAALIIAFAVGGGLSLPLTVRFEYLALLAPAGFVLTAAGLSFVPGWSPAAFPARPSPPPPLDGLPADARPAKA